MKEENKLFIKKNEGLLRNMDIGFYNTLDLRQRFFVLEFHEEAGD